MPTSCAHPIYKLRNPTPIRDEAGVIVGAEGPCRCGENWATAFFLGQTGDYTRKRDADVSESGGGARGRSVHGPDTASESRMGHESTEGDT